MMSRWPVVPKSCIDNLTVLEIHVLGTPDSDHSGSRLSVSSNFSSSASSSLRPKNWRPTPTVTPRRPRVLNSEKATVGLADSQWKSLIEDSRPWRRNRGGLEVEEVLESWVLTILIPVSPVAGCEAEALSHEVLILEELEDSGRIIWGTKCKLLSHEVSILEELEVWKI